MMRSVAEWDLAGERAPPSMEGGMLAAIEATLAPASRQDAAEELAMVLSVFDPPTGNIKTHTAACLAMLEDVPLDIVRSAMRRVIAECRFTPKPAEIRQRVEAELYERKRLVAKAKVAAAMAERRRAPSTRSPPTEAEKAKVSEVVSGYVAATRKVAA